MFPQRLLEARGVHAFVVGLALVYGSLLSAQPAGRRQPKGLLSIYRMGMFVRFSHLLDES